MAAPPSTGFNRGRLPGRPRREGAAAGWSEGQDAGFWGSLGAARSESDCVCPAGFALQIQCYQCEEFQLNNDCSNPEFIMNCTVNVQDMCQKEVMEQSAGKSPAGPSFPPLSSLG